MNRDTEPFTGVERFGVRGRQNKWKHKVTGRVQTVYLSDFCTNYVLTYMTT